MNSRRIFAALLTLVCWSAQRSVGTAAETYAADPDHMSIVFSASHAGFSYVYGFFRKAQGGFIIDKTNPANCRFRFLIDASSLDSNQAKRDEHLKSEEFFDVKQFPTIEFVSTGCSLANAPNGGVLYQVTGNMTLHGVTRQVTIPLRQLGEGKSPFNDYRVGFLCNYELKRSDYKMTKWPDMVGDAVTITISFEGILQDAAGNPARVQ